LRDLRLAVVPEVLLAERADRARRRAALLRWRGRDQGGRGDEDETADRRARRAHHRWLLRGRIRRSGDTTMSARAPEASGGGGGSGRLQRPRWKDLRARAEAFVVRRFGGLARRLPLERAVGIGERLGGWIGRLDRRRRRVGRANLELAYGDALDAAGRS